MNSIEFKKLIADREDWFNVTQRNGFDFTPILSGLYSDSSHFVYEILQNAEDAKAKTITFNIFPDKLEVLHDGKPFTFEDVGSITSIGKSTKVEDITAIGKFGVGFKSVYAITQSPTIRSGSFNFTIKNFVVPVVNPDGHSQDTTFITLPFDHQLKTPRETYELVKNRLTNLDLLTLLFLKNINKVIWNETTQSDQYVRTTELNYKGFNNVRRVTLKSSKSTEEYIVIERPIKLSDKELRVEVAYKLSVGDSKTESIVHSPNSKLCVFLPTNEETYLKFLVQGPFRTTPARDNIPFDDVNNNYLIKEIANLVAQSLPLIREMDLLDVNFLNVLPLKELDVSKQDIYKAISSSVIEAFQSNEALLPSHPAGHCTKDEALLANGKDLIQLLDLSDISELFKKSKWIHSDITERRTPEIREFLINQLGIPEIDFEKFGRAITTDFLVNKNNNWFKVFYRLLRDQKSLWRAGASYYPAGILRSKPIIRLENGSQTAPYDLKGNPLVYLPSTSKWKTHFKTVNKEIVEDNEALSFLKDLDLQEPNQFAEISEYLIPKYKHGHITPASEEYYEDLLNLLIGFQEVRSDRKKQFLDTLKELPIILCTKLKSKDLLLSTPIEVYFRNDDLQEYFAGYDDALFIAEELYGIFEKHELEQFLNELGVASLPRRIPKKNTLNWEQKRELYKSIGHTSDKYDYDFIIDGLDNFLHNVTQQRSILLWNLLIRQIQTFGWQAEEFFKGEYRWFFRTERNAHFDSRFLLQLREAPWLFDKSGSSCNPSSILLSDLSPIYDVSTSTIQVLIRQLKFKPDIQQLLLQQLTDNDRKKFEVLLGLSSEELEQMAALIKNSKKDIPTGVTTTDQPSDDSDADEWTPDVKPDDANISKQPFVPTKHDISATENQSPDGNTHNPQGDNEPDGGHEPEPNIPSRSIGRWGEKYIFRALIREHEPLGTSTITEFGAKITTKDNQVIEIIWLNIIKDRGRGCDFIIKTDGDETTYIEVKTTLENEFQLFSMTGTQWEFARKLLDNEQGNKYWIYRVFNAGKNNCQYRAIQNPIELWKAGKLFAHPINIEI